MTATPLQVLSYDLNVTAGYEQATFGWRVRHVGSSGGFNNYGSRENSPDFRPRITVTWS